MVFYDNEVNPKKIINSLNGLIKKKLNCGAFSENFLNTAYTSFLFVRSTVVKKQSRFAILLTFK